MLTTVKCLLAGPTIYAPYCRGDRITGSSGLFSDSVEPPRPGKVAKALNQGRTEGLTPEGTAEQHPASSAVAT